jgi:hypothetical protein
MDRLLELHAELLIEAKLAIQHAEAAAASVKAAPALADRIVPMGEHASQAGRSLGLLHAAGRLLDLIKGDR